MLSTYIREASIKYILVFINDRLETMSFRKEFYHQMLELAQFYLNNPTVVPCEFFSYDISWTLADESFTALCNIGNCRAFDFPKKFC